MNYTIEFTTAGTTCVYQAIANVVASGAFFGQPACDLDFRLTFNYELPHLISGGTDLCGTLDWESYVIEVNGMDAVNGTTWKAFCKPKKPNYNRLVSS